MKYKVPKTFCYILINNSRQFQKMQAEQIRLFQLSYVDLTSFDRVLTFHLESSSEVSLMHPRTFFTIL